MQDIYLADDNTSFQLTVEQLNLAVHGQVTIWHKGEKLKHLRLPSTSWDNYEQMKRQGYAVFEDGRVHENLEHVHLSWCHAAKRPVILVRFYSGREWSPEQATDPDIAKVEFDCITNHCWPTEATLRTIRQLYDNARMYSDRTYIFRPTMGWGHVPEYLAEKLAQSIATELMMPGATVYGVGVPKWKLANENDVYWFGMVHR